MELKKGKTGMGGGVGEQEGSGVWRRVEEHNAKNQAQGEEMGAHCLLGG